MAGAPFGLHSTGNGSNSISFAWTNGAAYDSIRVYVKPYGGAYSLYDTLGGGAEEVEVSGLDQGMRYFVYVAGVIGANEYGSNEVSAWTVMPAPVVVSVTPHATLPEIEVEWSNPVEYTQTFVEICPIGGSYSGGAFGPGTTVHNFTGLEPGCPYTVRLSGFRQLGDQYVQSGYVYDSATTHLPAPSNLVAMSGGDDKINLSWQNNASYSAVYLYVSTNGTDFSSWGSVGATSYKEVAGLVPGQTYWFKVRASRDWGGFFVDSDYSNVASATTGYPAPSNLQGAASTNQVALAWNDNTNDEDGFEVWRGGSLLETIGANVTGYTATGLSPSTWYTFKVRAKKGSVYSAFSNILEIFTADPPAAPSELIVTPISTSSLGLRWKDNSGNETGFKIEESADGVSGWAQIDTVGPNVTVYTRAGLPSNTIRHYRVRSYNNSGDSAYCAVAYNTTLAAVAMPTNLEVRAYDGSSIEGYFQDNSSEEDAHHVEMRYGVGGAWVEIFELAPNVNYFKKTGLVPAEWWTDYYFRVRARQGAAYSGYCEIRGAALWQTPYAPGTPTVVETKDTSIRIVWPASVTDVDHDCVGYRVKISTDGGTTYPTVRKLYTEIPEFLVMGLSPATLYHFKICAFSSAGDSADSAAVSATTAAQPAETKLQRALRNPTGRPIAHLEISPKMRVAGFTLKAGATYTYELPTTEKRIRISEVLENGTALTEAASIAAVETTAGSWFFDFYGRKLYVRTKGGAPPASCLLEAGFWIYVQDYATDEVTNVWSDCQYLVLLSASGLGSIDSAIDPSRTGSFAIADLEVTIANPRQGDGAYTWDRPYGRWTWRGRPVRLRLGFPHFAHAEFETVHEGAIDEVACTDRALTLRLADPRESLHRNLPFNHYWPSEYPALPDNKDSAGRSKPLVFGPKTKVPLTCVDPINRKYSYHDNGYHTGGVSAVYKNTVALVAGTDCYDDPWHNIVTIDRDGVELSENDALTCDLSGLVHDDNAAITNGITALRFMLLRWLGQTESDINRDFFFDAEIACAGIVCGIGLYHEEDSRAVIKRIEQTLQVTTLPDLQGRLAVRTLATAAPSGARYVREHMITDFRVKKTRQSLYHRVLVQYDEDPATQIFQTKEKISDDNRWKYSVLKTYKVETYLVNESDALSLAAAIEAWLDRDVISFRGAGYLLTTLPGDALLLTRTRYFSAAALAAELPILALKVSRAAGQALGVTIEARAL